MPLFSHKSRHHPRLTIRQTIGYVVNVNSEHSDNWSDSASVCFEGTSDIRDSEAVDEENIDKILDKKLASLFLCM